MFSNPDKRSSGEDFGSSTSVGQHQILHGGSKTVLKLCGGFLPVVDLWMKTLGEKTKIRIFTKETQGETAVKQLSSQKRLCGFKKILVDAAKP